jgi:hypothetical protein
MKKLLFALLLTSSFAGLAQDKFNPPVKKGTKLTYTIFTNGNSLPFSASVDSLGKEYVKLVWTIEGIGTGRWIMKKKSLESATHGYWNQPTPDIDEDLSDDMTVLILSKAQWTGLQQDKKLTYNDAPFTVKQGDAIPIRLNGKTVDAIQLDGPGSTVHLWVLNNPDFPALLKVEGNPHGVDLEISNIE